MKNLSTDKISLFALVLLITGAIDNIRNLPATALFGPTLFFFFIFAAIVFLIPIALVSAELASTWPKEHGGVYSWVKAAFGENVAFFTIWFQWVNTLVWYPSILSFIAGTLAYLVNPELAQHKGYLITVILVVFWSLTFLGLRGLRASAAFASFCALFGMILPMFFLIGLSLLWVIQGKPIAVDLSVSHLLPHWNDTQSWVSLTAMVTSFLGMELAAVHVRNIDKPQHNFPKAMFFSVILILATMILGSLAIAFVLPAGKISLIDGVMQAFTAYGLGSWMPVIVILILIGSVGSMVNWVVSPAKGLLLAADHGFLPQWLHKLNKNGVASRVLLLQAVMVTIFCTVFLLFPSINAIYWLFTALSTEIYVMMYILLFIAAWRLKTKYAHLPRSFTIPGGRLGYYFTCSLGLIGCIISLIVGFIPPENSVAVGSANEYRLVFSTGIFLMILPAIILYWRRKARLKSL